MESRAEYLHVLIFACQQCFQPLPVAELYVARSIEDKDSEVFTLACDCGWKGEMRGFQARCHWVADWYR